LALAPGSFSVVGCYFYGRALKIFFFKLNLMKGVSKEDGRMGGKAHGRNIFKWHFQINTVALAKGIPLIVFHKK